jgi:omega-amidase
MRITLVQTTLIWEDREQNLSRLTGLLDKAGSTDLIVLPEMFPTGFSMQPERIAENAPGQALAWMQEMAERSQAAITGSIAVREGGKYYNRLYWVNPDKNFQQYNKKHLFRLAGEEKCYATDGHKIMVSYKGWNFSPLVCYDLRFPVWCRNRFQKLSKECAQAEYDVLLFVANWPSARAHAWKSLLVARAIENQCFVIGVNRIGKDGNGYPHSGDSMVVDPTGQIIFRPEENMESVETVILDRKLLDEFRKIFPVGLDADDFSIRSAS